MSAEATDKALVPYEPTALVEYDLALPAYRFKADISSRAQNSPEELLKVVKTSHALAGENLAVEDLFFFQAIASNQRLDSYFTRMADSSLRNYAADAAAGVSFQNSHVTRELPLGRTITGTFDTVGDETTNKTPDPTDPFAVGDLPRVQTDVYTVLGLQLGSVNTTQFARGVQTGIIKDTSIGFKEGRGFLYSCSVCGLDLWDWDCPHIPGMEYEVVTNPQASPEQQIRTKTLAWAWIENARLSELSAVYDGATPNSMIVKATREIRAGRMSDSTLRYLESRYRFTPESRVLIQGYTAKPNRSTVDKEAEARTQQTKEKTGMDANETRVADLEKQRTEFDKFIRSLCVDLGLKPGDNANAMDCAQLLRSEVTRLQPLALDGTAYRTSVIDEAIAEGVRANGKDFNVEQQRGLLETVGVSNAKMMRDAWREIGDKRFGKGRQSTDEPGIEVPASEKTEAPAASTSRNDGTSGVFIPPHAFNRL